MNHDLLQFLITHGAQALDLEKLESLGSPISLGQADPFQDHQALIGALAQAALVEQYRGEAERLGRLMTPSWTPPPLFRAPASTISFSILLDPAINPFLRDHLFDKHGKKAALLPGVNFMQLATRLVLDKHPGYRLSSLRNVHFHRAVFVDLKKQRPVTFTLNLTKYEEGEIAYRCLLVDPHDPSKIFAEATVVISEYSQKRERPVIDFPQRGDPVAVIHGRDFYRPETYSNRGVMAMMDEMAVHDPDTATLSFSPSVLESKEGRMLAKGALLPLHMDLGFQGADLLEAFNQNPDPHRPMQALPIVSGFEEAAYFGYPTETEDELPNIQARVNRLPDGKYQITLYQKQTGEVFAKVTGFQPVLWTKAWEGRKAPTLVEFFGLDPSSTNKILKKYLEGRLKIYLQETAVPLEQWEGLSEAVFAGLRMALQKPEEVHVAVMGYGRTTGLIGALLAMGVRVTALERFWRTEDDDRYCHSPPLTHKELASLFHSPLNLKVRDGKFDSFISDPAFDVIFAITPDHETIERSLELAGPETQIVFQTFPSGAYINEWGRIESYRREGVVSMRRWDLSRPLFETREGKREEEAFVFIGRKNHTGGRDPTEVRAARLSRQSRTVGGSSLLHAMALPVAAEAAMAGMVEFVG